MPLMMYLFSMFFLVAISTVELAHEARRIKPKRTTQIFPMRRFYRYGLEFKDGISELLFIENHDSGLKHNNAGT